MTTSSLQCPTGLEVILVDAMFTLCCSKCRAYIQLCVVKNAKTEIIGYLPLTMMKYIHTMDSIL
jgi:hypothetical protein